MKNKSELEKILEFSLDIICTINSKGYFVRVSAAAFPIWGYRADELIGKRCLSFVYSEDQDLTKAASLKVMDGFATTKFENRFVCKDGSVVPMLWSSNWDHDEKVMYCIARDATAKKQAEKLRVSLEESNKRYEHVTKATSDTIWDWDLEKDTLYWGDGYQAVFGYPYDKTVYGASSWKDHMHPDDAERIVSSVYNAIEDGETNFTNEYRFKRKDGSFADVVHRGFVIRNESGKATRIVGALQDISDRKKSIAELKLITEDLYKRNQELLQFSYVVSHNLRSPVANIMGIANLMESDKDNPGLVDLYIRNLKASIYSLDQVIIDLSEILALKDGSAQIPKEPVDVTQILKNVATDISELSRESGAIIHLPLCSHILRTNKAYIYSIFYNLISNAIKYQSDEIPQIRINIKASEKVIIIEVSDNGIGIDMSRHEKDLFKPYKSFNSVIKGKGLGLFLVKSHVEALMGDIAVKSCPGQGSTFTIIFPNAYDIDNWQTSSN